MATRLKAEIIKQIESDHDLFALVAKTMGIKPVSLPQSLNRNNSRLTNYEILTVIAKHTGNPIENLLEEVADEKDSSEDTNTSKTQAEPVAA